MKKQDKLYYENERLQFEMSQLKTENDKLRAALDRMMSEVNVSTDSAFYEHCKSEVERILADEV